MHPDHLPLAGEAINEKVPVAVCSTSNERAVSKIVEVKAPLRHPRCLVIATPGHRPRT